ncbi:MAG: hypothetical protein IJV85_02110 [Clostridia bacterium]|nr:hypothetical protein [Clostridia bacterium]
MSRIRNTPAQRASEKRKFIRGAKIPNTMATGRVRSKHNAAPAENAERSPKASFSALLLEMRRETLMGIPPAPIVRKTEKRERAT